MCRECDLQAERGAIGCTLSVIRAARENTGRLRRTARLAAGFLVGIMNGPGTLVPVARPSRLQPEDLRRDGDANTSQPRRSSRRLRRNAAIASNDTPSASCLAIAFRSTHRHRAEPYFTRQRVATIACASARSSDTYCRACRFEAVRRTASQCCARMPTTTHTAIPKRTDIKKPAHVARAGSTIAAAATALRPSPPRAHLR